MFTVLKAKREEICVVEHRINSCHRSFMGCSSSYKRIKLFYPRKAVYHFHYLLLPLSQENNYGLKAPSHSIDTSGCVELAYTI